MKYVYFFGNGQADGGKDDRDLLGGKGADLQEMSRLGVNVRLWNSAATETSEKAWSPCGAASRRYLYPRWSTGMRRRSSR